VSVPNGLNALSSLAVNWRLWAQRRHQPRLPPPLRWLHRPGWKSLRSAAAPVAAVRLRRA